MYATDIACSKWKSFKVFSPIYFWEYKVDKIWYDKRLWNYLVLKHWEYKFVYAHTVATVKAGDRLKELKEIWYTDKSWISENYHLHFEIWKWNDNISFKSLIDWKVVTNPLSSKLQEQRWWINIWPIKEDELLKHIKDFEWLHLKAYPDWPNRYSIGYGTKSFKWETITKQEADKRAKKVIKNIVKNYWLNNLDINKQKALVSFVYNVGSLNNKQVRLLRQWHYRALWNELKKYNKMTVGDKKVEAWWLIKRRQNEFTLLTK